MKSFSILIGLFSAVLFGMATPISKVLLQGINEFQLAGLLYLGSAGVMLPVMRFKKEGTHCTSNPISFYQILKILGAVIFGGILGPVFLLFGLKTAHAASVSIWLNMELVATAILGVWLFNDHLDKYGWTGVLFTFFAGIIMAAAEGYSGLIPALLVTSACFCWGFDNHFTALIDCISPSRITFIKGIFAGSFNLVLGFLLFTSSPGFSLILFALILGAFSYGLSILLYVISAQNLGATRSQILFSSSPFFGIIIAFVFLKETMTMTHFFAAFCILIGIYYSNRIRHNHRHKHVELVHTHLHRHDDEHHDHLHDGFNVTIRHSHQHTHKKRYHSHLHYPDLHHRHAHI